MSPFGFVLGGIVLTWALFRYQLFDVAPVARKIVIEGMGDGMLVLDMKGRLVDLNPAAQRIADLLPEQIGQLLPQPTQAKLALAEGREEVDIKGCWYDARGVTLTDKQARAVGRLIVLHDITERKQAEDELRRAKEAALEAQRAAEAANRAKSAFLANMSHELRTPLNAILGFAQLLVGNPHLPNDTREGLRIINSSGEHLLSLINDVLDMSKIEAGKLTYQEQAIDLHKLLDELEAMLRVRAEAKRLRLVFEREAKVPQFVRTDMKKLRQVLINLVGNAIKFTQAGNVSVRIKTVDPLPALKHPSGICNLQFEIQDTGTGVLPEDHERIFQPFTQVGKSTEGTGLGLAIARQFVRLMGGELGLKSAPGRGSLFSFDIVVGGVEHPEQVQPTAKLRRVVRLEAGQDFRVLIADDRESNRLLLVKLLQPLGFEVRQADNGQEALEVWQAWAPHLILMDVRMPVLDGMEATRRIKATEQGQRTRVVMLTASTFEEEVQSIQVCGCEAVVRKPFRQNEILGALERHLGARFVYEAEEESLAQAVPISLHSADLAALPAEWQDRLCQASLAADAQAALDLIAEIRPAHSKVAAALEELVNTFQFEQILDLLQEMQCTSSI